MLTHHRLSISISLCMSISAPRNPSLPKTTHDTPTHSHHLSTKCFHLADITSSCTPSNPSCEFMIPIQYEIHVNLPLARLATRKNRRCICRWMHTVLFHSRLPSPGLCFPNVETACIFPRLFGIRGKVVVSFGLHAVLTCPEESFLLFSTQYSAHAMLCVVNSGVRNFRESVCSVPFRPILRTSLRSLVLALKR